MNVDFLELFQAVFKQFGAGGYGSDNVVPDEAELQHHQKLEKLYISTRAAKVIETLSLSLSLCGCLCVLAFGWILRVSPNSGNLLLFLKMFSHVFSIFKEILFGEWKVTLLLGTKLSEDSRKYGTENTCTSGSTLSKAASSFGRARAQMEKEHGNLLKSLGTQVAEPLRAMVMGAPLEDARHLAQRYDRVRQEAESQAIEVSRRQAKFRETGNPDVALKLEASETKLQDLKSNMGILGKEAAAAMSAVEAQQQRLTLQRLITMIESERTYHQRVLQILDQLEGEMISERQRIEAPPSPSMDSMPPPPSYEEGNGVFASPTPNGSTDSMGYFLGEVMYSYQAEADVELNLSIGDYIVVRKVSNNGWAEGECKGKAGWFPIGYIERRERVLASKVAALC
ncbi:hypothetical protein C3L33_20784, partial [Rhododendron williamsianum]